MPLHDYRCPEHGLFESLSAQCLQPGCSCDVSMVFLKPVGYRSERTQRIDHSLRKTAESFGMTNLNSAREGDNHANHLPNLIEPAFLHEQPVREAPKNVLWGEQGGKSLASVCGGNKAMDLTKGGIKDSPLAEGVRTLGGTLAQRTEIVGSHGRRTAQGVAE